MDHTAILVDPALTLGWIATVNTAKHLVIGYIFKREEFPWVQNWGSYPATGNFARGLELSTQPYDEPRREAVAKNGMFGAPTFRWLPAKSTIHSSFLLFYAHTPEGFGKAESVRLERPGQDVRRAVRAIRRSPGCRGAAPSVGGSRVAQARPRADNHRPKSLLHGPAAQLLRKHGSDQLVQTHAFLLGHLRKSSMQAPGNPLNPLSAWQRTFRCGFGYRIPGSDTIFNPKPLRLLEIS